FFISILYSFSSLSFFFFFNDTATSEIYTLSLHDALPICSDGFVARAGDLEVDFILALELNFAVVQAAGEKHRAVQADESFRVEADRKSTRLNSSHVAISYAVFCLKKKKNKQPDTERSLAT